MSMQIGFIASYAGSSVPTGWLACDGSSLLRSAYPALFAVIGTTYGAADGSHFNLPDCRNRMVIGAGSTYSLAATGGASTQTLTESNLPSHTHTISIEGNGVSSNSNDPDGNYLGGGTTSVYDTAGDGISYLAGATASNTGSGTAFNILNPYIALTWCIAAEIPN